MTDYEKRTLELFLERSVADLKKDIYLRGPRYVLYEERETLRDLTAILDRLRRGLEP